MKAMKLKSAGYRIKDMDMAQGRVILYASAFGNIDADGDIMERGAYAKTIAENGPSGKNRIKQLYQHNAWELMGKPMTMQETDDGLLVDTYISDIKNGDYRKMYEDGLITEHSVGFIPVKEEYNRETGVNVIKEVRLFEYSAVTWGANEMTPVIGMKSMNKEEQANFLIDRLDKLSKALNKGSFTDETFNQFQIQYEQIKAEVKKALAENEPPKGTPQSQPQEINLVDMFENLY